MSEHPARSSPMNVNFESELPALLEDAVHRAACAVRDHLEREPAKVLGVAAGVWLALQLAPRPWIARGVTTLAHAGLLALGACKVLEMLHAASLPASTSTVPLRSTNPVPLPNP